MDLPFSHQVAVSDRGRWTSNYERNSDGNVQVDDKFMDRKRHPLHPWRLGGNPNNGKNDTNGADGKNGTNEC